VYGNGHFAHSRIRRCGYASPHPAPTLTPASHWSGEILMTVPAVDYIVKVRIIRPTGFTVIVRSYDDQGEQIP